MTHHVSDCILFCGIGAFGVTPGVTNDLLSSIRIGIRMEGRVVALLTFRWGALLALALALSLASGLGCGASSTEEKSSVRDPASPSSISAGYKEGNQIIPFSVLLRDGSLLTSDQLLKQGQPIFMLFFKPN